MKLVKILNPKSEILNNTNPQNPNDQNRLKERFVLNFEFRYLNLFRFFQRLHNFDRIRSRNRLEKGG